MKSLLPKNVYAGVKATNNLPQILIDNKVKQAVIFTDKGIINAGLLDYLKSYISEDIELLVIDDIAPEPSYQQIQQSIDIDKNFTPEIVIGIGGGSVIDSAKLFSILYQTDYKIKDLIDGELIKEKKIISLMIPTTCGTGAEATINSIVAIPEKEVKMGIVMEAMLPDYVILDSHYVMDLPKAILASAAIDAFCHGIECYTSNKANLISDIYAQACCELTFNNIERAYTNKDDEQAKLALLIGSFFGGLAITSSGTTAVHALSYPLGGKFKIPHGVSNAILLYDVFKVNQDMIEKELATLANYLLIDRDLSDLSESEKANLLLIEVKRLVDTVEIPSTLTQWNVSKDDLEFLVTSALAQKRLLGNNKKDLTYEEIESVYLKVIE